FTFYNLTRITYPDATHDDFTYDAQGNALTFTDRRGKTWTTTYNARGQPLTVANPTGGIAAFTYNADGTLAASADSDASIGVTAYTYDAYKRLSTVTRPGGNTVQFTYDLNDRLLTVTDERGKTTTFTYDANGNLDTAANPLGQTYTYAQDLMDRLTSITDPVGQAANLSYDAMNRLASVTDRNGNTTTFGYNSRGWRTGITDPAGKTWTTAYDDEGVPASVTTPLGFTTAFQTDDLGRITRFTDPLGRHTHLAYDDLGRLTTLTDRMGRVTTYTYDAAGRLASVARPVIGAATYTRNDQGLLTRITDQRGKHWDFGYSAMGRLISHTDPLGRQRTLAYDSRGRVQQISYPSTALSENLTPLPPLLPGEGESDAPSLAGKGLGGRWAIPTAGTSGSGAATYTYDAASNVTQIAYSGGPTLDFTYDDAGRLLTANHIALTYDARGDVTNSQDGSASFGATYDNGQRLKTVTYPSTGPSTSSGRSSGQAATTVAYTYDARDLLTRVEDNRAGAWMNFTYDHDGRLTGVTRSNGVGTTFTYDAAGRVTRIQDGALADQQYTLNAEGEPTQVARTLPLDPPPVISPLSLTYDAAAQISSPGYAYDARGRQIAAPGKTFTYDGASRLTQVAAGGSAATLTYNGLGDLRARTVGGTTTTYYHNYALGLAPIVAEETVRNTQHAIRYYVYTPGGALLYSIDPATNQARFYHFDRIGSTLFLTDGAGAVSDAYAYDPYGNLLGQTGSSDQPFTYVGQYGVRREPAGNLYDMRARAYDPITARFLTRDPLWPALTDPQGLNPYQYANQNPLRYIDPQGLNYIPNPPDPNPSKRYIDAYLTQKYWFSAEQIAEWTAEDPEYQERVRQAGKIFEREKAEAAKTQAEWLARRRIEEGKREIFTKMLQNILRQGGPAAQRIRQMFPGMEIWDEPEAAVRLWIWFTIGGVDQK
ncbi:MAG: RHS repeat-associated core domain-containing protein, partial [Chloroflexi bacterium]|nr:RHS repeat-associated core domain-containing protein [Chloroflexota bacterium]